MSLGYSRLIAAGAAAGLTVAAVALAAAPAALADQARSHEWWLANLHVPTAWQSSRGGGVTVAVLDTGVDAQQPDLAGAVVNGPDFTNSGRKPGGPHWGVHGTVVASLIAGRGHGPGNRNGVLGVAPAAQILSVRVTLEQTDPLLAKPAIAQALPGAIAHGIRYAVNHGATVIDLPLDPVTAPGAAGAGGSAAEQAAVNYALHRNVVLVAPAGDGGGGTDPVNYPAAYPGVVAVGAFDSTYTKPAFTTHHSYVTVTAPGVNMIAATPAGYATVSSTAASSAVVSGIVALIRAQDPALSPAQVTKVLEKSTVYRPASGRVPGSGFGTVDAGLAILAAARMDKHAAPPTQAPSPAAGAPSKAPAAAASAAPATSGGSLLLVGLIGAVVGVILLIVAVLLLMQIRRRRARAARLAPIRVAAQMQPRRAALPAAEEAPGGADAVAERNPASTSVAFAPRPDTPRTSGAPPWELTPWPSAAPAGSAADLAARGTPGSAVVPWSAAGAPAAGSAGAASSGALVPANPGSRLPQRSPAARSPSIAGTPPWEPAPKPETELPWTASPPRRPAGGGGIAPPLPHRRPQPPQGSPWDAMAEEAWPGGGPGAGRPQPALPGAPGSAGAGGTGAGTAPGGPGAGGSGTGGTPQGGFGSLAGFGGLADSGVGSPGVGSPGVGSPGVGSPGVGSPGVGSPGPAGSGTGAAGAAGAGAAGTGDAGGSSPGIMPGDSDPAGLWAAASGSAAGGSGAGAAGGAAAPPWPAAAPWSPAGSVPGAADEPGGSGLFVDFGPPPASTNGNANGDASPGSGFLTAGLAGPGASSPDSSSTGSHSTTGYSTADYSTGSFSAGDYSTGSFSAADYSTGSFSAGDYSTGSLSAGGYGTGSQSGSSGYSTGGYSTAGSYSPPGGGERDDSTTETGSKPLSGWNPGDATESFPRYRPDDD